MGWWGWGWGGGVGGRQTPPRLRDERRRRITMHDILTKPFVVHAGRRRPLLYNKGGGRGGGGTNQMVDGEVDAGKMRGTDKSRKRRKTREPNNKSLMTLKVFFFFFPIAFARG